jgi:hypothetical protein
VCYFKVFLLAVDLEESLTGTIPSPDFILRM